MAPFISGRDVLPAMIYGASEHAGISSLVVAGGISGLAVLFTFVAMAVRSPKFGNIHVIPYFISLLVANVVQAIATALSGKWVITGTVEDSTYCSIQGVLKNGGNFGMALWSFAMSVHVFVLLFLRKDMSNRLCALSLVVGWTLVGLVVAVGPLGIQTADRGPYFGPSGYWCWITVSYPREQFFMEYFYEFLSAGLSFILYTIVLLRVRGNLILVGGKWSLRFVPRGERWQLALRRDNTDSSMMQVAARMVWHPVAYTVLILPVTVSRFVAFGGREVPFWATIVSDFIFNLQGVANVILLVSTRRLIPDTTLFPIFVARKEIDMVVPTGITPFLLSQPEESEKLADPSAALSDTVFVPPSQDDEKRVDDMSPTRTTTDRMSQEGALAACSVNSHTPMLYDEESQRVEFSLRR
ncbi:hypothetical protein BKA93DRAFT_189530 [Sparassis latifolia]